MAAGVEEEEEAAAAAGVSFSVAAVAPAAVVVVVVSVSVSCSMGSGGGTALLPVSSCLSFLTAMESGDTIEEAEAGWAAGAGPGGGAAAEDLLAEVVVVEVEAAGAATEDEGGGCGVLEEDVDEDFALVPAVVTAAGGCEEFAGDLAVLTSTTWLPSFRLASITLTISLVLVRTLSMLTITSLLFSPALCSRPRCSCRMSRPRAAMASSSSPDSTTSVSSSQKPADNTSWILTRTEART